jgi:RNA polymerase sigma factor for flagellar operon FliA
MRPIAPGLHLLDRPERAEASLWRRFRATGQGRLRENLFDRYHRFARSLARRHAKRNDLAPDLRDDLEQLAYRGLLEAIDRFDPRRGAPFISFAAARIAGSMIDGLGSIDERGARLRFKRRVERERLASLAPQTASGDSATAQLADLVTELALSLMLDMEERGAPDDLAGRPENGFDSLAWRETKALLSQRVDQLPEPEQSVIRHHYQHDLLFTQIAAMLGLSQGRVSQIHKAALARLRKSMRSIR